MQHLTYVAGIGPWPLKTDLRKYIKGRLSNAQWFVNTFFGIQQTSDDFRALHSQF